MKVTIRGASDDLIEVEGDIDEEFNPPPGNSTLLAFGDGTLLKIRYDGCWRITPVSQGTASYQKIEAPEDDDNNYSDRVTLDGDLRWCVLGVAWAK